MTWNGYCFTQGDFQYNKDDLRLIISSKVMSMYNNIKYDYKAMFMKEIPPMILTNSKYKGRVPQLTLARTTCQKI